MPAFPDPALFFNPWLQWTRLALKNAEMLTASSQVIGTRVGRMAAAGPNPSARDRKEFMLMGSEKLKAAGASNMAVATHLQSAQWQRALEAWQQGLGAWSAMAGLGDAALQPYHRASTANARRLGRAKARRR